MALCDLTVYLVTSQNYGGLKFSVCEFKILPFLLRVFHGVIVGDIQMAGQMI